MISRPRPFTLVFRVSSSLNPTAPYVYLKNLPILSAAAQSTEPSSLNFRRTLAVMATEYQLKFQGNPNDIPNGHKVEVEVDGIEGGKVLLLKVNGNLKALSPRCTRTSYLLTS